MDTLLYVDPSPRGEWASSVAALLPHSAQRRLVLLATDEDVEADPSLLARARPRLAAHAAAIEEATRPGPAERAVVEECRARAYGLVIVPPAGRNAIQRMLKGSRIAAVVRAVRAPVLVARRPPPRIERILAAVSGGRGTRAVCVAAGTLADALGAVVTFLHVASEVALPYHPHGHAAEEPAPPRLAEDARSVLASLGRTESLLVHEGLVIEEVLVEFEHGAHHLLVLGASVENDAAAWGREDVTERILLRCPGSTLVVPADAR